MRNRTNTRSIHDEMFSGIRSILLPKLKVKPFDISIVVVYTRAVQKVLNLNRELEKQYSFSLLFNIAPLDMNALWSNDV